MRKFRIARLSIDGQNAPRRMMFEATHIEEGDDGGAVLWIANEAMLVLPTMDELLATMGLSHDDIEET